MRLAPSSMSTISHYRQCYYTRYPIEDWATAETGTWAIFMQKLTSDRSRGRSDVPLFYQIMSGPGEPLRLSLSSQDSLPSSIDTVRSFSVQKRSLSIFLTRMLIRSGARGSFRRGIKFLARGNTLIFSSSMTSSPLPQLSEERVSIEAE